MNQKQIPKNLNNYGMGLKTLEDSSGPRRNHTIMPLMAALAFPHRPIWN